MGAFLRLIGQINGTGIGRHYTAFAKHINASDPIRLLDGFDHQAVSAETSTDDDVNISFTGIWYGPWIHGRHVQWVVFETDRVPDVLLRCIAPCDRVWVPSRWGQQVLRDHGIDSAVVPEGVDSDFVPADSPPPGPMRFLTIGKYEQRKGIDDLIEAWRRSLADDPGTELVIKTDTWRSHQARYQQLMDKIQGMPNVKLLWGHTDEKSLRSLYQSSHVFVSPNRGEGWGLPIIEAAASGLPIITTRHSAPLDYLAPIDDSVIWCSHHMVPVDDEDVRFCYPGQADGWGTWAQVDIDDLSACLVKAKNTFADLRSKAKTNSDTIHELFSWTRSVNTAWQDLQDLGWI